MNGWERSHREQRPQHRHQPQQRRKTPSFSSSLLDAIYRSIDESKCEEADDSVLYRESTATRTKNQRNPNEETLRQAIMIEKLRSNEIQSYRLYNSNSSSSDSSCGGVFSSSETESGSKSTSFEVKVQSESDQTPKREGRLTRTKSKALKIYGDLKKAKQPISPGRRITNFLNSLFNSKNGKREPDLNSMRKSRSVKDTPMTCSLSSSFSRSCLSKPISSRAKLNSNNGGSKRCVRFLPVSVIVDEDSRPCGHKRVYEADPSLMPTPIVRKIAEKTINNQIKNMNAFELRDLDDNDDDEDDDDGVSCASSDLFELENIGEIGVGPYGEELPVYGTTSLKTHHSIHAISNGLIL
ncbi:Protein BIG GRAIN 1-like [Actinidia chinensis var. chinensis]|uniref:Protein BIG GRAIN 1-like n=1 Tax=Actinidia chinensis var. chinensis TaxID=1590841 RepID=A0A2R6Q559_ACTCC|nr:Protein BIG GRAIN 1-like [Actinidia chinensis var. chinensis]